MDGWKTTFLLGWPIFSGYVSFREGKQQQKGFPNSSLSNNPVETLNQQGERSLLKSYQKKQLLQNFEPRLILKCNSVNPRFSNYNWPQLCWISWSYPNWTISLIHWTLVAKRRLQTSRAKHNRLFSPPFCWARIWILRSKPSSWLGLFRRLQHFYKT